MYVFWDSGGGRNGRMGDYDIPPKNYENVELR